MPHLKLSINAFNEQAEHIADCLTELGALTVSFTDAGDQEVFQINPDETPLWQKVKIDALFIPNTNIESIIKNLCATLTLADLSYQTEILEDQDWVRQTQQQFKPQCYNNKLWICPSYYQAPLTGIVVKIDPGLAFGTGTHPTTQLCLEWLAANDLHNKRVIDYGCGSGILALAALALGAKEVITIDHDPQALEATRNNAALNEFVNEQNLHVLFPTECPNITAPVVIANILANPLLELSDTIIKLVETHGHLVLSGLLINENEKIIQTYNKKLMHLNTEVQEEWTRIEFIKTLR